MQVSDKIGLAANITITTTNLPASSSNSDWKEQKKDVHKKKKEAQRELSIEVLKSYGQKLCWMRVNSKYQ